MNSVKFDFYVLTENAANISGGADVAGQATDWSSARDPLSPMGPSGPASRLRSRLE